MVNGDLMNKCCVWCVSFFLLITLVEGQLPPPEFVKVDTPFIVAMSITAFFVVYILGYAVLTHAMRVQKAYRKTKSKKQQEQLIPETEPEDDPPVHPVVMKEI